MVFSIKTNEYSLYVWFDMIWYGKYFTTLLIYKLQKRKFEYGIIKTRIDDIFLMAI